MSWGTACCRVCDAPLIPTFMVRKNEFYCIECGSSFGFMEPKGDKSVEAAERYEEIKKEWDENVGENLIIPRSWKDSSVCEECSPSNPHEGHATAEEWKADKAAREWIDQRITIHE